MLHVIEASRAEVGNDLYRVRVQLQQYVRLLQRPVEKKEHLAIGLVTAGSGFKGRRGRVLHLLGSERVAPLFR